jgi:hypothetical protein
VAAAAAVLLAFGLFAFHDTGDHADAPNVALHEHPETTAPAPARPVAPRTPAQAPEVRETVAPRPADVAPSSAPSTAPESVPGPQIAQAPQDPDEEDPAEEDEAPRAPRGIGPANSGRPSTAPAPAPAARPSSAPATPGRREQGPSVTEKAKPSLACTVASLEGSIELRKGSEKSWRALTASDVVEEGDAVRAKGVDSGFTFVDRAAVKLDADASGRVSYSGKTVAVALESGSVEGEALVRYGLKISDANGTVTVWKGARVRVESLPEGLRVCVDEGKVRVENSLGHCILREGSEAIVVATKAPHASAGHGPRRTPRGK